MRKDAPGSSAIHAAMCSQYESSTYAGAPSATWPNGSRPPIAASAEAPSINGNAGTIARFAGSVTSDTRPKCIASSGTVASVAATVTAVGSASALPIHRGTSSRRSSQPMTATVHRRSRDASSRMPAVAPKLSWNETSSGTAGSMPAMIVARATGGDKPWLPHYYLGHGIGTNAAEMPMIGTDLGQEWDDNFVFPAGMALVLEPVVWEDGTGGYRSEEIIVVTDDGWMPLTDYSYDPYEVTNVGN